MSILTPNMNLPESVIGIDSGTNWEINLNSSLSLIDLHDHSPGKGVPIGSESIFLSSDLALNDNDLTLVKSVRFEVQPAALAEPSDVGAMYETGVDFWYNDANGNKIQVTRGGVVNATSFGISSPPASAFFIGNVLVVNANVATPANIQGASWLLGNNILHSNFLTLMPPAAMGADYQLTLPPLPSSQKIMTLDASGIMTAPYVVDNTTLTIASNVIKVIDASIVNSLIADHTIVVNKRVPMGFASPATANSVLVLPASLPTQHTSPTGVLVCTGSITTTGRSLRIILQPAFGGGQSYIRFVGSGGNFATFVILVDGGAGGQFTVQLVGNYQGISTPGIYFPVTSVQGMTPSSFPAGTHSVSLYAISGGFLFQTVTIAAAELVAYEI